MSFSSLKTNKKSLILLVLAMMMQVYQAHSTEGQSQPAETPQQPAQSGTLPTIATPGWGQNAYSAVSALPLKVQAGLAGLTTASAGYSFYRGKLWWNKSRALKNYSYLLRIFNGTTNDGAKKNELIRWINNDYPRYQQAKEVTEKLRSPEQLEVIRFPFTVFKQELEQAIKSLGSDSWTAWAQGDTSVTALKTTLTAILNAVKTTEQYKGEAPQYAAYQQMTAIEEQDKRVRECNSRVVDLQKQILGLTKKLNKQQK